jgi:hypothetical protein
MSDVRTWLVSIGLAQYAGALEINEIDMDLLMQIDDQILKDIGIAAAGHRIRLRNAIAELAQWSAVDCQGERRGRSVRNVSISAERRQVTVLFSDRDAVLGAPTEER